VTVLRSADGRIVMELERSDVTELRATGWTPAEVFTVKARDGSTDLWGILHKPGTFDATKKDPIITNIYPGPQIGSVRDWVFDMLLVPDAGHQLPPYAIKRAWDYFVRHLQGVEPDTEYRMIGR